MLTREICNACQVETKVLNCCSGLIIRPQRVLSVLSVCLHCVPGPTLSPVLSNILSEHIRSALAAPAVHKPALVCKTRGNAQKPRKKRDQLLSFIVFHSVAGPSHFIQHQQITNNHLFTASRPLGTSPVLNQLYAHIVYNGKDSVLHSLACTFFKTFSPKNTLCFKASSAAGQQLVLVDVSMSDLISR